MFFRLPWIGFILFKGDRMANSAVPGSIKTLKGCGGVPSETAPT